MRELDGSGGCCAQHALCPSNATFAVQTQTGEKSMKLLEHVRQTGRVKHFSYRTEKAYAYWAERYFRFHLGLPGGNGGVALADEPTKSIAISASSPSARQPVQRPSGATLPGNRWRWGVFSRISTGCQRATACSQAQNLSRPLTASATPPRRPLYRLSRVKQVNQTLWTPVPARPTLR